MTDSRNTTSRLEELLNSAIGEADPTLARRLETDPEAYLDLVTLAARTSAYSNELLRNAVASARAAGLSWEAIGARLGVSRQAAQQRFSEEEVTHEASAGQLMLRPLTAFNEMSVLEHVGKYGWHSVGFGPFYHLVVKSDRKWLHTRVPAFSDHTHLTRQGWQKIGQLWFPWAYYKLELSEKAEPEPAGFDPMMPA